MRRSWASLTVGLLVLIVGVISYKLIRMVSERNSSSSGIAVWGLFRDASGLFEKSRVQTAGIQVGQIEERKLDDNQPTLAKITVRLLPNIKLYENAVIAKKSASLLGEYYLEIDPGTSFGKLRGEPDTARRPMHLLKDGDQVKDIREPTAMGDIMDNVGTLLPILHDILDDVRKLTSGTITDIADNVNKLIESNSDTLSHLLERVDNIAGHVDDVTSAEAGDVKESIKNVREITESIKDLMGTKGPVTGTTQKVQSSIDRLQATIDNLDRSMKNIEAITDRVNSGQGTVGHLLNDDAIANNVEDITENASGFIRSVTKLQTIVGLRTEYNFLSHGIKNYLSVQLMPRPDKFYLIELIEDPRGYSNTSTTVTQSSLSGVNTATTVTTTDALRFSLMFGKRVSFGGATVAGRFGIKESTGGVGADLYLFDDRLSLSVDLFGFAQSTVGQNPRLKASLGYELWNRTFYVVGGADDLLNYHRGEAGTGGGFDWFLGLMLRFNDEDLKSLLLVGGGAAAGSASK